MTIPEQTQWPTPTGERAQEHEALKLAHVLKNYLPSVEALEQAGDMLSRQHTLIVQTQKALAPFAVYGRPGSRDVEVGEAIAALTAANDYLEQKP